MKYEWKQTIFTPEDFSGSGQYIVREGINKTNYPHIMDTGYLSTVMKKVGYTLGSARSDRMDAMYCLIDMSDGLTKEGYFVTKDENGNEITDSSKWKFVRFAGENNYEAKKVLCEYLNNNPHGETYRKATTEEVVRVVLRQKHRCA